MLPNCATTRKDAFNQQKVRPISGISVHVWEYQQYLICKCHDTLRMHLIRPVIRHLYASIYSIARMLDLPRFEPILQQKPSRARFLPTENEKKKKGKKSELQATCVLWHIIIIF